MSKKRLLIIITIILTLCIVSFTAYAQSPEDGGVNFGVISLLPPLLAIVLAFITKQVLLSLFLGVFVGALLLYGGNPFYAFLRTLDEYLLGSASDSWNAAILIFTLSIGGMIGVVSKMGGTKAIAEALAKKTKTARGAQIVTWILGVLVFFDDYANTLIVGPTMRPLSDKMKVSREKLSYIIDSTAAPIAGMALVSTWVGYEIGVMRNAYEAIGVSENIYFVFLKSIPYTFYNIIAILLVLVLAITQKEIGPMYHAERRARLTGKLNSDTAKPMASDEVSKMEIQEGIKLKASNAIIPILTLVLVAFAGLWYNGYLAAVGDGLSVKPFTWEGIRECFGYADASVVLIWGAITASIVAIILAISQKILTLSEAFDAWVDGAKSLVITAIILILAWSLGRITSDVGTADFLVKVVSGNIPAGILPIIVFLISCLVSFSTGTSWGTMAIVIPLAVPLANSYVLNGVADPSFIIVTMSSVLSGGIFGDHCSPISDTTIMSSMAAAADHMDHVKTQAPYALLGAGIAMFCYVLVGIFKLNVFLTLIIGAALTVAIVYFFGKSVKEEVLKSGEKKIKKAKANKA
ncbi:MAG: Na+/H+ antiporter NhaC family protein [Gottschalkiaceae bacterium]|nr:MAG: Na+/H+ antiporter NhaC family protein [Gottschalkiaceae bacterium]